VALLDGAQVDDGTAWEIGYANARGIPVIGLRTDFRLCADSDDGLVNAMIQGSVVSMCRSADEVLEVLGRLGQEIGKA
ncbi:MAG: nucleoside 2-deoxyribosyltransferase, partial [Clostridia bacterium]|nr:nucleoside 2-deoxyribosyltransferase [Clostridia bacterium]